MKNHHDENSGRPTDRKPVQRIQKEDGRTLRNDEEEHAKEYADLLQEYEERSRMKELRGRIKNLR